MTNQESRLLEALKQRPLTSLEIWGVCGIYRASDAIFKLRKNHDIVTERISVNNRFGE